MSTMIRKGIGCTEQDVYTCTHGMLFMIDSQSSGYSIRYMITSLSAHKIAI